MKAVPESGFTVVELVIVVAVVALLAGVLVPVVGNQIDDARRNRASADMDTIARAFTTFRRQTSTWPGSDRPVPVSAMTTGYYEFTDYACLYENVDKLVGWRGPYLEQGTGSGRARRVATPATASAPANGLVDPWGQPYRIYVFAQTERDQGTLALLSRGPDGRCDTSPRDILVGATAGDDLLKIIARRL